MTEHPESKGPVGITRIGWILKHRKLMQLLCDPGGRPLLFGTREQARCYRKRWVREFQENRQFKAPTYSVAPVYMLLGKSELRKIQIMEGKKGANKKGALAFASLPSDMVRRKTGELFWV